MGLKIKLMPENKIIPLDPSNLLSVCELKEEFLQQLGSDELTL